AELRACFREPHQGDALACPIDAPGEQNHPARLIVGARVRAPSRRRGGSRCGRARRNATRRRGAVRCVAAAVAAPARIAIALDTFLSPLADSVEPLVDLRRNLGSRRTGQDLVTLEERAPPERRQEQPLNPP